MSNIQYALQIRANINGSIGSWVFLDKIDENIETDNGFPNIKLSVSSRNYIHYLSERTFDFEAFGELRAYILNVLVVDPNANTNSIDILLLEESSECGSRAIGILNISAQNVKWCFEGKECTVKADAKGFSPEYTAILNTSIKSQFAGGIFESGNFDPTAIAWLGYVDLSKTDRIMGDPVRGNIPAVYIRRLIQNALDYIQVTNGISINYTAATDTYFSDTASPYYDAAMTNFVVGGVDYTTSPHLNPSAHEGEVLGNLPNWTLYDFLEKLTTHYLFTWRLVNNGGTYSLVIKERDTWNGGLPVIDLGLYQDFGYIDSYCSKGEPSKLPNRIDYKQADGNPIASGHNRTQYSEFANFVVNASPNQYEPQTIQDPFQGTCFDNDGSDNGAYYYNMLTNVFWGGALGSVPLRTFGGFIVVDKDKDANPDEPKIIIVDTASTAGGMVAISRPYTAAEDAYRATVGMNNNNSTPAKARNWHEWIGKEFCSLSGSGGFGSGRWDRLKRLDPIAYPYYGRMVTVKFCYSCNLMQMLGMYSDQTPAIDYAVKVVIPFLIKPEFTGYIDNIAVVLGDYIQIDIRY